MTARETEKLERDVAALTERAVDQLAVGGASLLSAIVASMVFPELAIPLLVAGVVVGARGLAAYVRRTWLLEDAHKQ